MVYELWIAKYSIVVHTLKHLNRIRIYSKIQWNENEDSLISHFSMHVSFAFLQNISFQNMIKSICFRLFEYLGKSAKEYSIIKRNEWISWNESPSSNTSAGLEFDENFQLNEYLSEYRTFIWNPYEILWTLFGVNIPCSRTIRIKVNDSPWT